MVAAFNNSSLGFVQLEQKVEGLLDAYADLKNPDFARVAQSIGFWGLAVDNADELDAAVARSSTGKLHGRRHHSCVIFPWTFSSMRRPTLRNSDHARR